MTVDIYSKHSVAESWRTNLVSLRVATWNKRGGMTKASGIVTDAEGGDTRPDIPTEHTTLEVEQIEQIELLSSMCLTLVSNTQHGHLAHASGFF